MWDYLWRRGGTRVVFACRERGKEISALFPHQDCYAIWQYLNICDVKIKIQTSADLHFCISLCWIFERIGLGDFVMWRFYIFERDLNIVPT
jgi:hypothetical protein